jgi:Alkylmercury lyase
MADPDAGAAAGTPGLLTRGGGGKRAGLAVAPRAVHQAVLRGFASTGRPPEPAELEDAARQHSITARQALGELSGADVLGLDGQGRIRMAYPFSAAPTGHVVAIAGGPRVYSMCAIDALGIPAMLGTDAVITSSDPLTGEPVTVTIRGAHVSWEPPGAVVFDGGTGREGPSEQVCCGYLNFFASASSARHWASQHPEVTGSVLDQARAQALGAQVFGSLLSGRT